MAKNWAIAIGVNRYDFLPPLHYAKQDAQAIQTFLSTKAGFERVFFFSDDSPPINEKSTQPSRANLLRVFRQVFENPFMGSGDNFWFFFSGHGIRHEERDYLLPADGDPEDVENTAISIHYVTERLRRCGADNIVFILDACRNQSRRDGQGIGYQTAEIARQAGVVSIFSCSPNEYSYEVEDLQQGIFTAALLEGLGDEGHCATVENLDQYLASRVPDLSRQYDKPRQIPYTIAEPLSKRHLILLPQNATSADVATLKNEAYRAAQITGNLELSEQLWIRVLAASSGRDMEAIKALQRIAQLRMEEDKPAELEQPTELSSSVTLLAPPEQEVLLNLPEEEEIAGEKGAFLPGNALRSLPRLPLNQPASTQKSVYVLTGHTAQVQAIAISPDGRFLASGSYDQTARLWDAQTGKLLQTFEGHSNLVTTVAFGMDGRVLVSGSGDNTIKLWDCDTGELIKTLTGHSGWVLAIALSPSGKTLASGSADGSIKLWNLDTFQERRTLNGHFGWVRSVAFSPDGSLLVSGSHDQTIKLWYMGNGEVLDTLTGHSDHVSFVAVTPDGKKLVSASQDQTIKLWHLEKRKLLRTISRKGSSVSAIALSADGKLLASSRDQAIELWHLRRGKRFRTLAGHGDRVSAIAFNPDGKLLISGSHDRTIRVWQTRVGQAWTKVLLASTVVLLGLGGANLYRHIQDYCPPQPSSPIPCLLHSPWVETVKDMFKKL
jgi:WD40 repeat protein